MPSLRFGMVRAFDTDAWTCDVEITGYHATKLEGVPLAWHVRQDLPIDGTPCVVLFNDEFAVSDAVVLCLYGGRPPDDPQFDPVVGHKHRGLLRDGGYPVGGGSV